MKTRYKIAIGTSAAYWCLNNYMWNKEVTRLKKENAVLKASVIRHQRAMKALFMYGVPTQLIKDVVNDIQFQSIVEFNNKD